MSEAKSKLCPLCGKQYSADTVVCPADGRVLVTGSKRRGRPVRLSSATEKLLGNILTDEEEASSAPAPSVVVPEELSVPGAEGREENTVATAYSEFNEVALDTPLAAISGKTGPPAAGLRGLPRRSARGVFTDLRLEYGDLEDVADDDVTRRVERRAPQEGTIRSELPPEFLEDDDTEVPEAVSDETHPSEPALPSAELEESAESNVDPAPVVTAAEEDTPEPQDSDDPGSEEEPEEPETPPAADDETEASPDAANENEDTHERARASAPSEEVDGSPDEEEDGVLRPPAEEPGAWQLIVVAIAVLAAGFALLIVLSL